MSRVLRGYPPVCQVQITEHTICLPEVRIPGALNMGAVAVILKVMPESTDVDLEALKQAIREKIPGVSDIRDEPIGFGLVALKVATVIQDEEGATEGIESQFNDIPGIDRVEIVDLSRMI